jgi:hypothetical protein
MSVIPAKERHPGENRGRNPHRTGRFPLVRWGDKSWVKPVNPAKAGIQNSHEHQPVFGGMAVLLPLRPAVSNR